MGISGAAPADTKPAAKAITIKMVDQQGRSIGTAIMAAAANGVAFKLDLKNLPPGSHALVLHEVGKCDTPDFKSASSELTTSAAIKREGGGESGGAATGVALDDVTADAKGNVRATIKLASADVRELLIADDGSALIVHAAANPVDDGAGRIACGVIVKQ